MLITYRRDDFRARSSLSARRSWPTLVDTTSPCSTASGICCWRWLPGEALNGRLFSADRRDELRLSPRVAEAPFTLRRVFVELRPLPAVRALRVVFPSRVVDGRDEERDLVRVEDAVALQSDALTPRIGRDVPREGDPS